nr:Nif3-like dinuclear metal center hexameric protein [Paraburkholderia caribensis]
MVHGRGTGLFRRGDRRRRGRLSDGEISEPTVHTAAESGVAFISAGHHATERYGVQALGAHLSEQFELEHLFIDIHNPV